VTRFDDFFPIWQLLTSGSFLKITKAAKVFWTTFFHSKSNVGKNGLGYILGDFFTNSTGRLTRLGEFLPIG
jgi:hypothetical protein